MINVFDAARDNKNTARRNKFTVTNIRFFIFLANAELGNNSIYQLLNLYTRFAPNIYLPAVIAHIKQNLLPQHIDSVTKDDISIMNTTPGTERFRMSVTCICMKLKRRASVFQC